SGAAGAAARAELRKLIWQPLIDGANEQMRGATTVLLSPEGPLCRFPLGALPGSKPDTYLIEELAVGVIPIPVTLPELLATSAAMPTSDPSLLVVGEVAYGA